MSYILEALQKSDQERESKRVPSLATIHPIRQRGFRRPWVWASGGVLVIVAGLLVTLVSLRRPYEENVQHPAGIAPPATPSVAAPAPSAPIAPSAKPPVVTAAPARPISPPAAPPIAAVAPTRPTAPSAKPSVAT